jgi:peroxiredoxin
VGVLAVAADDSEDAMRQFMTENGYTFPVMLDGNSAAAQYGVRAIPTTVVIDPQGRVVKTLIGATNAADLSKLVDDLTG